VICIEISSAEWTTEALIEELGAEKRMLEEAVTAWVDRGMIGLDEGRGVWVLYEREGDKPSSKPKPSKRAEMPLFRSISHLYPVVPFLIPKGAAGNPGHLTPPASKDPLWGVSLQCNERPPVLKRHWFTVAPEPLQKSWAPDNGSIV